MNMAVKKEAQTGFVNKAKKQKKDKIPEEKVKVKTEKMVNDASDNVVKKKKRKLALNADAANDVDLVIEEVCKKKKKLGKSKKQTENADLILVEEPLKEKKKIKNKSIQTESNVEIVKIENEHFQQDVKKSKKAKKVKKQNEDTDSETIKKHKKKKTKPLAEEKDISTSETVREKQPRKIKSKLAEIERKIESSQSDLILKNVKIKKKKKDKSKAEENKEITHKVQDKYSNNEKEKMEKKDSTQVKKKKHKKTKSEKELGVVVESKKSKKSQDDDNVKDNPLPKKKRKRKTPEENDEEPILLDSESDTMSKSKQKKKSKKEKNKINAEADAGLKKKIKKLKKERLDPEEPSQVEVVFLSEKTGNADEVNINKERRQALQMEIDQASQPPKPAKPSGLGQWGSAEFGSSEQQQKFLRLMGGFKKGFQPASSSGGGGNMALGRDAQQQLQQGLLGEFERAHSRRMDSSNRGAGLGFSAPSKKFSIDANMTRSIRFDD